MACTNCKDCLLYDELIDGILTPCDEEWKCHFCIAYQNGIPEAVWKRRKSCPDYIKDE
mgnify:CR=1 FL=1